MRTIYQIDNIGVWTGASRSISQTGGRPPGWIESSNPPPEGIAQWVGHWRTLDKYPDLPAAIPEVVSMAAAREALIDAGKLGAVESAIDAIEDDTVKAKARSWWEYSVSVRRSSKWIAMLAPAVPLTEEEIDQLFIAADEIDQNA